MQLGTGFVSAVILAALGCGGGDNAATDASAIADGVVPSSDGQRADGAASDAASVTCGEAILPLGDIAGTEGIAISDNGIAYYSQGGAVGRSRPGEPPDDGWVVYGSPGDTTWGLALDTAGTTLYVASPDASAIFQIDVTATTPQAQELYAPAGSPNGLVVGPDGAVYYTDFTSMGRVYRVDVATGTRTQVTAAPIAAANGLFFASATELYVLAYSNAEIWRLDLDVDMTETGRALVASVPGSRLDGIGRDTTGRWYVTDNQGGRLLRLEPDFSNASTPEVLLTGVPSAANIAWGKGLLDCEDVYVTSSGNLARFAGDVSGTP